MAFLEDVECLLPFVRAQAIGDIEPESLLYAAPRAGGVLEVDVGGFLSAHFTAEAVESGHEVFERVADQMDGQFLVNRFGKGEILVGEFKVLREDLKRVVHAAVVEIQTRRKWRIGAYRRCRRLRFRAAFRGNSESGGVPRAPVSC